MSTSDHQFIPAYPQTSTQTICMVCKAEHNDHHEFEPWPKVNTLCRHCNNQRSSSLHHMAEHNDDEPTHETWN